MSATSSSSHHPSSIDLEAFACGETIAAVTKHLGECDACTAFVERLKAALSVGPSKAKTADAMIAKLAARVEKEDAPVATPATSKSAVVEKRDRKFWSTASTIVVPLAAAAALIVFLRSPSTKDSFVPVIPSTPTTTVPTTTATATIPTERKDPETTFKGGIQIAVIRERDGQQARYTDTVSVKPGDRLRVEVALDRDQAILAAVMGDDASWLELMAGEVRQPGTYFSERSARVDASPLRGTILVGAPSDIAVARETKDFSHVASIRVDWESAP